MFHTTQKLWAALLGWKCKCNHHVRNFQQLMSALDNLNTSLTTLATSVDAAVAVLGATPTGGATEAQVQAIADTVAGQASRLSAATPPPAPAQ